MSDPLGPIKRVLQTMDDSEKLELLAFLATETGHVEPRGPKKRLRTEYRKCPKGTCKSCDDGNRHGPYIYEVWREGRSVRRRYVRKGGSSAAESDGG